MKDLSELSVKQLQAKLVKLGMPEGDVETFTTKKPLIATINTLRANQAIEKADEKESKKQWTSKKEQMRAKLMAQPKVRILIPLEGKEKVGVVKWMYNTKTKRKEQAYIKGAYLPVQLNGFKWLIPKGKYVEVPEQIADLVSESQQMTSEAGKDWLIDREDPKTGQKVRDRL